MKFQIAIQQVFDNVRAEGNPGSVAAYIPELAKMDPEKFGVHLSAVNKSDFGIGAFNDRFSIQSIAKVLSVSLAYSLLGEKIWQRVGVEPSGTPFNSLVQLESDHGIPRNPFINAGALVICDVLIGQLNNAKQDFLDFVREVSGISGLTYSSRIAESERITGYRNVALCNFIKSFGNIQSEPETVLDFYFNLCSLEMSCREVSETFLYLANGGVSPARNRPVLDHSQTKRINALMQTCGLYDESGEFAFKVGLPGKSGVGGGILAVHPHEYSVCVWSPRLNEKGNSHRGVRFLELFTTETKRSIF